MLLPQSGTFRLRTGPETTDTATVTVARTGTTLRLTGLPSGYSSWSLYLRATNAGGHSNWASASVSNDPQTWPRPAHQPDRPAQCGRHGGPRLDGRDGGHRLPGPFPVPGRCRGGRRLGLAAPPGLTVTVTGATAAVGACPRPPPIGISG